MAYAFRTRRTLDVFAYKAIAVLTVNLVRRQHVALLHALYKRIKNKKFFA